MKNLILLLFAILPGALFAREHTVFLPDTVFQYNEKSIQVIDTEDGIKVKIYQFDEEGNPLPDRQVFEGVYKDGTSRERRFVEGLSIPFVRRNQVRDPHWGGFGMGFAKLGNRAFKYNNANIDLRAGKSFEFVLNFCDFAFPLSRRGWAFVTGAGFRWDIYRLDGNVRFQEDGGITQLLPAPADVIYTTSRLKTTYFTIPLLLEWQKKVSKHSPFFVSAGIVAGAKIYSNSVVKYLGEDGRKRKNVVGKDLNLRPVTMDVLFQAGLDIIGVYTKFSPISLFQKDKGPDAYPASIGLMLYF